MEHCAQTNGLVPEDTGVSPGQLSALDLAFVGDGVYDLLVREHLVSGGARPVGELHRMAVRYVRASAQSDALEAIRAELTEEETAVFKRGRNANGVKAPKNALLADYRRATGLEALFGWLYLSRKTARLRELFSRILAAQEEEGQGLE